MSGRRSLGGSLLLLLAICAVMLLVGVFDHNYYRLQLLTKAGVFAPAIIGFTLLMGTAGQISLGQAAFFGAGAYASAFLLVRLHAPFWLAFASAGVVGGLLGVVVGYSALRLRAHTLAMATAAFALLFPDAMREIPGLGGADGITRIPSPELLGFSFDTPRSLYFLVWVAVALTYLLALSLLASRVGRGLQALRDDPLAAGASGIPVAVYRIKIFVFSAVLAGLSGSLYASMQGGIFDQNFSVMLSIDMLIMAVVGGLGSIPGAVFGSIFIVYVPELGRRWEDYRLTAYGFLLILAIIFLPKGLAGLVDALTGRILGVFRFRRGPVEERIEGEH